MDDMGKFVESILARLAEDAQDHIAAMADLNAAMHQQTRALDRGEYVDKITGGYATTKAEILDRSNYRISETIREARAAGASEQQIKMALMKRAVPDASSAESAL